jgi:hypothetical protein
MKLGDFINGSSTIFCIMTNFVTPSANNLTEVSPSAEILSSAPALISVWSFVLCLDCCLERSLCLDYFLLHENILCLENTLFLDYCLCLNYFLCLENCYLYFGFDHDLVQNFLFLCCYNCHLKTYLCLLL